MASVKFPCTGTNRVCSNKGDKVVLGKCLGLSVLFKINAVQYIYLTDFNYSFFHQYLHFERRPNFLWYLSFLRYGVAMETN